MLDMYERNIALQDFWHVQITVAAVPEGPVRMLKMKDTNGRPVIFPCRALLCFIQLQRCGAIYTKNRGATSSSIGHVLEISLLMRSDGMY